MLAYLTTSPLPSRAANSIHVMLMAQAFAQHGHDVLMLAPALGRPVGPLEPETFAQYDVAPTFAAERLRWDEGERGRTYRYGWRAAREAKRRGATLAYGRCLHSCYAAALLGLPVVFEAHITVEQDRLPTRLLHKLLLRHPRFQRVVVISEALAEAYHERYGVPREKIVVAHDAARDEACAEPLELGEAGRMQVAYIGHLYPGRGVDVILEAARASADWADFHIIGGRDEDIAAWKTEAEGVTNVRFHGFVPYRETTCFRIGADALLAPYQRQVRNYGSTDTGRYMSPLKVFEYMAAGTPIVASDLPVLGEVLRHDDNALLCEPDDPVGWVRALEHLRDDPARAARLAAQARADFLAHYTWEARARTVLAGLDVDEPEAVPA